MKRIGRSSASFHQISNQDFPCLNVKCSFTRKTESAVCIETLSASESLLTTTTSAILLVSTGDVTYWPLTVTAGLSKLNAVEPTVTPNGPSTSQQPLATENSDAAAALHRPVATAAPFGVAAALAAAVLL